MAAAANIAPTTTTPATGTDITVAAGARVTVGLYVATGALPHQAKARIEVRTPGANAHVASLAGNGPSTYVLHGPGTYVATLETVDSSGVAVGVFTDAG